jgi:glycerophosphoryl diester phosphodiesterase
MHRHLPLAPLFAAALTACAAAPAPTMASAPVLAPYFDCLRDRNETLVSAHRAGPAPGLPENALETMAATLDRNPRALLEIDVQRSADGVLFLFHDDRLERLTTGRGTARDLRWHALSRLRLKDDEGTITRLAMPRLAQALDLARSRGAIVQLDVKRGVPFAEVVAAVRTARATRHAVIITYTGRDAADVARLAPELMVSVGINDAADLARLTGQGVPATQMLAWTGTRSPDPALFALLRRAGVEPMFGTLGRPGERLDDRWLADGDPSEFAGLASDGAIVIGTDRAAEIEPVLRPVTCRAN